MLIAQAARGGSSRHFRASTAELCASGWPPTGAFATGMIGFARSRQELARSKCKSRRPAIAPPLRAGGAFASRRDHPAQMGAAHEEPRCPFAGSLSARDFRRRFPGGPRRPARQGSAQPFRSGDRAPQERNGRTNIDDGRSAICRRAITSTSGRTASICRRGWSRRPNACWC